MQHCLNQAQVNDNDNLTQTIDIETIDPQSNNRVIITRDIIPLVSETKDESIVEINGSNIKVVHNPCKDLNAVALSTDGRSYDRRYSIRRNNVLQQPPPNTVQIHKNFVNIGELKVQKHLNKTAYTERPRAADNTVKGPYRRNHQYNSTPINTINPYVNNNDSAEGSLSQNCPIPTRITQRDQKSKKHRGLSRKRYSHYKFKKHNNVISKENDHLDEVFRTGSHWKTKMKFFQLYY